MDTMFAKHLSGTPVDIYQKGQYDFQKDIKTGEQGEEFVKEHLINSGFKFIKNHKGKEYDLLMSFKEKQVKYEIKTDVYPKDTGNIAIEFECRNKPSGINVTESDYFVTYFPMFKEIWNIKTDKLKHLIQENSFRQTEASGDDGSNTKLYLINKKEFAQHFKVHKMN